MTNKIFLISCLLLCGNELHSVNPFHVMVSALAMLSQSGANHTTAGILRAENSTTAGTITTTSDQSTAIQDNTTTEQLTPSSTSDRPHTSLPTFTTETTTGQPYHDKKSTHGPITTTSPTTKILEDSTSRKTTTPINTAPNKLRTAASYHNRTTATPLTTEKAPDHTTTTNDRSTAIQDNTTTERLSLSSTDSNPHTNVPIHTTATANSSLRQPSTQPPHTKNNSDSATAASLQTDHEVTDHSQLTTLPPQNKTTYSGLTQPVPNSTTAASYPNGTTATPLTTEQPSCPNRTCTFSIVTKIDFHARLAIKGTHEVKADCHGQQGDKETLESGDFGISSQDALRILTLLLEQSALEELRKKNNDTDL